MVCVPTAIPNPRRTKTQAKKTPAIQRKTNANQVNDSPGLPAWWARANRSAEPVTASVLARTCGICKSFKRAKQHGHQDQPKQRLLVNPGAQVADQGRERRFTPARADRPAGDCRSVPDSENPKSIRRLMPRSTTAQTMLSMTMPARIPGENRQS